MKENNVIKPFQWPDIIPFPFSSSIFYLHFFKILNETLIHEKIFYIFIVLTKPIKWYDETHYFKLDRLGSNWIRKILYQVGLWYMHSLRSFRKIRKSKLFFYDQSWSSLIKYSRLHLHKNMTCNNHARNI